MTIHSIFLVILPVHDAHTVTVVDCLQYFKIWQPPGKLVAREINSL